MKKFYKKKRCRICDSSNLVEYINLGNQPFANSFLKKNKISAEDKYPLKVMLCKNCGLSQLSIIPNPKYIFDDYDYLSSSSRALVNHYNMMVKNLIDRFDINANDSVLDIGCNDGILLNSYPGNFKNIIGVEPSKVYKQIKNKKIKIFNNFFSYSLSKKIKVKPKIITITNVFAHIDNIKDFVKGLKNIMDDKSILVIEFPYIKYMIEKGIYDVIYHEHLSYLSLTPIKKLLDQFQMRIFDSIKINFGASGPSLRIFICLNESGPKKTKRLQAMLRNEKEWGIKKIKKYRSFKKIVENKTNNLRKIVCSKYRQGFKIGCFSAPAKGNTLLNYLNLDKNIISSVCENNKSKINKYTPGTHIKIINDDEFIKEGNDYALLLSWNYKDFFVENSSFIKSGGKFIIPFPNPKILK